MGRPVVPRWPRPCFSPRYPLVSGNGVIRMQVGPRGRYALAVLAGFAIAGAVVGITQWVNAPYARATLPRGTASCTGFTPLGWAAPFLVGGVVLTAVWFMARQSSRPGRSAGFVATVVHPHTVCGQCRQRVMSEWSLCPYCGAGLERSVEGSSDGPSGEGVDADDGDAIARGADDESRG